MWSFLFRSWGLAIAGQVLGQGLHLPARFNESAVVQEPVSDVVIAPFFG